MPIIPLLYDPSLPPSDLFPHDFICAPSANRSTSAMPPLGPTLSFYGRASNPPHQSPDNDYFIFPTPSSPLLPLSINPLSDLPSLHFCCSYCPTSPLPHLYVAVSGRFHFLPSLSYRISATNFSIIPLCLFCMPRHISFHHPRALSQHFSPIQ